MLFNHGSLADLPLIVVGVAVLSIFAYTSYNIFMASGPTNNESLVNTIPNLDTINDLPESAFPILDANNLHKIDVGVQTDVVTPTEVAQQATNLYVDASVQTPTRSLWRAFKDWILDRFTDINSSSIQTPTTVRVENWMQDLSSTQEVSSNDINSVVSVTSPINPIVEESVSIIQSPVSNHYLPIPSLELPIVEESVSNKLEAIVDPAVVKQNLIEYIFKNANIDITNTEILNSILTDPITYQLVATDPGAAMILFM